VRRAVILLGLVGLFASQFAVVKPTNFGGADEWLFLWLGAHGILASPYANRPLNFLWTTPGALLTPFGFAGYYWLYVGYLAVSGWLVFALVRCVVPGAPLLALVAAGLALVWAPSDMARLTGVQMTINGGFAMGTLAVALALALSWRWRSRLLLAAASVGAGLLVLGYEGVAPLLAAAPLLVLQRDRGEPGRRPFWAAAFWGALGTGVVHAVVPLLSRNRGAWYQAALVEPDPHPLRVSSRLLHLYQLHLQPAFDTPLAQLGHPAVIASAVLLLGLVVWHERGEGGASLPLRSLARLALVGVVSSGLGYLPFALARNVEPEARTEFLATPGMGLFLAAVLCAAGAVVPRAGRGWLVGLLAAWLAAVGTARTLAMQRRWDEISAYPEQVRTLQAITHLAPRVLPHTLVVLIDETRAFRQQFTFRHAVEYLYPGEATAIVHPATTLLYPTRVDASGVTTEPWPVLREPWGVSVTHHGWPEVIAFRRRPDGGIELVNDDTFLPVARGHGYCGACRVRTEGPVPPERAVLDEARRRGWPLGPAEAMTGPGVGPFLSGPAGSP
jgi:hypothetical protein